MKRMHWYTYVDVDLNGAYDPMVDVIVAGTPPAGTNLVYTTDLAGNSRVVHGVIDRGAYETAAGMGTVICIR